ncbi:hypothetical protein DFH08DRAFT_962057 [Mycena albidolilacea]|uniref:FHA domain-containing protein n=1 Tax=Mycena albidolilacea TaxID=1033008 RepID=A0AAD6ZY36_9AGAR|nr:hypothetical protein DFH08DRAFT_962057 [Mycena albidolilacea]
MESGGNDSPPLRSTILGSFLGRGRPRNSSQSHIDVQHHLQLQIPRELSPSPPTASNAPASPAVPMHANNNSYNRRRNGPPPVSGQGQLPSTSPAQGGLSLGHMLRRRRSAGNVNGNGAVPPTPVQAQPVPPTPQAQAHSRAATAPIPPAPAPAAATAATGAAGGTHRIRLVPHLDSRRSLRFDPIARDLKPGEPALRIGRFTDRSGLGLAAVNALSTNKIAFKSKVVSRAHAEVWIEDASGGGGGGVRFLIRDTKSSSGTFLNHVRLSPANAESRPHPLKDGDILQLGVDYQGGAEDIYKSVKIRIEIGREWQSAANAFKCLRAGYMDVDGDAIAFYYSFCARHASCLRVPTYTYCDETSGAQIVPELGVLYRIVSLSVAVSARASARVCILSLSRGTSANGDERPVRIRGLAAFASRIVLCRRRSVCRCSPYAYKPAAGRRWAAAFRPTPASRACTSAGLGLGRARPGCFRHSFESGLRASSVLNHSFLPSHFFVLVSFSALCCSFSLPSSPLHVPLPFLSFFLFRFRGEISPHGLLRGAWGRLLVVHLALGFSWSSEPWRYGVAKLPNDEPGQNRLCYPRLILHIGLGSWRAAGGSGNHPSSGLCFATPRRMNIARRLPISQFDRLREPESGS